MHEKCNLKIAKSHNPTLTRTTVSERETNQEMDFLQHTHIFSFFFIYVFAKWLFSTKGARGREEGGVWGKMFLVPLGLDYCKFPANIFTTIPHHFCLMADVYCTLDLVQTHDSHYFLPCHKAFTTPSPPWKMRWFAGSNEEMLSFHNWHCLLKCPQRCTHSAQETFIHGWTFVSGLGYVYPLFTIAIFKTRIFFCTFCQFLPQFSQQMPNQITFGFGLKFTPIFF